MVMGRFKWVGSNGWIGGGWVRLWVGLGGLA